MTQLEYTRKGITTPEMIRVAIRENVTREPTGATSPA
jgi:thiamine biosynthesis protein ThiC